jgi:hypothetical protein
MDMTAYQVRTVQVKESGWARTWGSADSDRSISTAVDANGNVYVLGLFQETVDFDPGPGVDEHTSVGDADFFLSKFDSTGNFKWAHTWGSVIGDYAAGVAVDSSGNVYFTGSYAGTVDFDPGPGVDNHTALGDTDAFLVKLDSSGNFIYAKTWGGPSLEAAISVAVSAAGSVYVAGFFYGTVDLDPGPGASSHTASGNFPDVYLSKFDSDGIFLWGRSWGGDDQDVGYDVAVSSSDNPYVVGCFSTTVDFDTGGGTDIHDSVGQTDAFLSSFDKGGSFIWAKTWGGTQNDAATGCAVDSGGNTYVVGGIRDTVDFDPGPNMVLYTSAGKTDAFLSKFDSAGILWWAAGWGGLDEDGADDVVLDPSGNPIATGYYSGTVDFSPGGDDDFHTSNGNFDAFISKFDSLAHYLFASTWGGPALDMGMGIAVQQSTGDIFVSGLYCDTVDMNPGAGTDNHTSNGLADASVSKFLPTGVW